jgi:hypothetical protein
MGRLLSKLKSVDFYRKIPKCVPGRRPAPPPRRLTPPLTLLSAHPHRACAAT